MIREHEHIEYLLRQLCTETASDVAALGLVNFDTRKLEWRYKWGSDSEKTQRIKQRVTAGLTGKVLRTGRFIQLASYASEDNDLIGESIMMTEKLCTAAAWPVIRNNADYNGIVIIGNRTNRLYKSIQMKQAANSIKKLEEIVEQKCSYRAFHHYY